MQWAWAWALANELYYVLCVCLRFDDIDSGRDDGKRKAVGVVSTTEVKRNDKYACERVDRN